MGVTQATIARRRPRFAAAASAASSSPFAISLLACVAIAALSAAVLPTVPSYDPWSWIVWGREVFDPHLSFTVGGGPSWKPLPVIFTTIFGLFGSAAPTLWVIAARVGGVMALVAAYRLASRLVGGRAAGGWAVLAGVAALAGVLLTQEWFYYMFRGTSEPTLVGASLWAIDRHLDRRYGTAFVLGVVASLIRPEWWPFVILYAAWLWFRQPRLRVLLLLGLFSIPFFWFVPPWIGTGQPFIAASHAKDYNGHLGSDPFVEVLRRGADLQVVPSLVLALAAVAVTWWRERDRLILGLAASALAWWVLVVAMTLDGYPGLERFYLPAAGVICVLAGVGLVRVAQLAGPVLSRRFSTGWVPVAAALILLAASVPFTISRIDTARAAKPIADRAVTRLDQMTAAVAAVGGHDAVYPCKSSFAAVNHGVQTALAWKLHVTLELVGTTMRHPGVWFVGPHDSIDGGPAPLGPGLTKVRFLTQVGAWKLYRVWRPNQLTSCVGR
jgi:hypothetical protein